MAWWWPRFSLAERSGKRPAANAPARARVVCIYFSFIIYFFSSWHWSRGDGEGRGSRGAGEGRGREGVAACEDGGADGGGNTDQLRVVGGGCPLGLPTRSRACAHMSRRACCKRWMQTIPYGAAEARPCLPPWARVMGKSRSLLTILSPWKMMHREYSMLSTTKMPYSPASKLNRPMLSSRL
jgi:hypothetical protein